MLKRAIWSFGICIPIFCAAVFAFSVYGQHRLLYPTPETKSIFLRDYKPENAVDIFMTDNYAWGGGVGSTAGEGLVKNEVDYYGHLAIHPQESEALMINLKNDLLARLRDSGASGLKLTGDMAHGYHFDYQIGNSVGWGTIAPLEPDPDKHGGYLAPGSVEVLLKMSIRETWRPTPRA